MNTVFDVVMCSFMDKNKGRLSAVEKPDLVQFGLT